MASDKEYLDYILDSLSGIDGIGYRAMMGEYIIYYKDKVVGGIYDNRFLLKPTESAVRLLPNAPMEIPYEGAKAMLMADLENTCSLNTLFDAIYSELPAPKRKRENTK